MRRRTARLSVAAAAIVAALGGGAGLHLLDRPSGPAPASPEPPRAAEAREMPQARDAFSAAFRAGLEAFRAGDPHGAARSFSHAAALRPHSAQARVNLGFAYLELGRPGEALALFEAASGIAPRAANAYFGMAEALEALGDMARATGAMRTFLHLAAPDDPFRRRARAALWEWGAAAGGETRARPAPAPSPPETRTGIALLDAPVETLDGAPATLARHGGKIVVLNVWATWCGPCRAELPSLQRLSDSLDPERFAVVGLSIDGPAAFPGDYLRGIGITFANYRDAAGAIGEGLLAVEAVPRTLVLSADGEVLADHVGARDWAAEELVAALRGLAVEAAPVPQRVAELKEALR